MKRQAKFLPAKVKRSLSNRESIKSAFFLKQSQAKIPQLSKSLRRKRKP
ncbi:MAG: hypothetical protein O4805_14530 [Trichodesmium sp. St16_bin2-tuft]|nr:hypothetical protein [Trichodesmium sp. St18_bin1]MDE5088278.1 hypothetical protein [Trichodesmium sp. St16_bin2-tuft]MDE5120948.1 hypothetical protein [Trichodesmium sp. St19_bin1]